ncbi:hypothetical protein FACS1894195_0210 [Bacteroidia bacterium]|nr:hypothetical protein FACS1894195_0210 [Bacteroidia bacterium]
MIAAYAMLNSEEGKGAFVLTVYNWLIVAIYIGLCWFTSSCSKQEEAEKKEEKHSSVDGVLFSKDKTTLIKYPQDKQGAYIIPEGVTKIDNHAFQSCKGLTSVSIPSSTEIGVGSFWDCTGLTSLYNYRTTPQDIEYREFVCVDVFEDVNLAKVTLYVPAGSESTYRAAKVWKEFGKIVAIP